jgi:hypothetical protein
MPLPIFSDEAQDDGTRKATFQLELAVNRNADPGTAFLNPGNTVTCDFSFPGDSDSAFTAVGDILIQGADPGNIAASVGMNSYPSAGATSAKQVQFNYQATGAYPGSLQVAMVMFYR